VADPGVRGYAEEAERQLNRGGIEAFRFHDFQANPDSTMVAAGRRLAEPLTLDSIVGIGGGSSMDCAKAINLVLTNGGRIQDYWGYGKASKPMLPMIGVPTTTGTGSEAQTHALISDSETHVKMAIGDPQAAFRIAILDPGLACSQPVPVRAVAGYDAVSHAIETWATTKRSAISQVFSREAWRLLESSYERVLTHPEDIDALGNMQLGAWFAGLAIENSMLGATHACANPLTARYGTPHGVAIASLLCHVVRWNGEELYRELSNEPAARLSALASAGSLATSVSALGVPESDLPLLSDDAAKQWTGRFNPKPFDAAAALEIYRCAY
jgi:alcohol dehydrogenase